MDVIAQFDAAIGLLGRLGIEVRQEHFGGGGGGFCTVRGRRMLFVDLDADGATRLERALAALADLPELDNVYVPPALRESIEHARM